MGKRCPIDLKFYIHIFGTVIEYKKINPRAEVDFIDPKWQVNYRMFNRLKIDPFLYKRYKNYKFIMFYELDAWVFKDELSYWCDRNYDYLGAPWYEGFPNANASSKSIGVGNGGFSLRKVKSHLRVLNSFSYIQRLGYFYYLLTAYPLSFRTLYYILQHITIKNNTFYLFNNYQLNEDVFWGIVAKKNFKWFTVPAVEVALKFSVEVAPSQFINSIENLPFGCHAWERYEPEFWKQYISSAS